MARFLHHGLELLAGVESHDTAGADGDLLAGLWVASRALWLVAQLEVTEAGELDALPPLQRPADLFEEGFDHVLGLALVQPDLLEQQVGEFGLRQSHPRLPWCFDFRVLHATKFLIWRRIFRPAGLPARRGQRLPPHP